MGRGSGAQISQGRVVLQRGAELQKGDAVAGTQPVEHCPLRSLRVLRERVTGGGQWLQAHVDEQIQGLTRMPVRGIQAEDGVTAGGAGLLGGQAVALTQTYPCSASKWHSTRENRRCWAVERAALKENNTAGASAAHAGTAAGGNKALISRGGA